MSLIVFILLFTTISYASFYSSISCKFNSDCSDRCDGAYWYYSKGICSSDCYPSTLMHCQYNKRVCADTDASDGFPNINCQVRTCGAQCDQNSDCSCPKDGCVESDYYSYPNGTCNESCQCDSCEPSITANDSRCMPSFIEVNKTAEPTDLTCSGTSISLIIKGIGKGTVGTNVKESAVNYILALQFCVSHVFYSVYKNDLSCTTTKIPYVKMPKFVQDYCNGQD